MPLPFEVSGFEPSYPNVKTYCYAHVFNILTAYNGLYFDFHLGLILFIMVALSIKKFSQCNFKILTHLMTSSKT